MKSKPASGLTSPQIDAITLELAYATALADALHAREDGRKDPSFHTLLARQLAKVESMICDTQIGGRKHG